MKGLLEFVLPASLKSKLKMPEQAIVKAMAHVVQKRKGTPYKPKETPQCKLITTQFNLSFANDSIASSPPGDLPNDVCARSCCLEKKANTTLNSWQERILWTCTAQSKAETSERLVLQSTVEAFHFPFQRSRMGISIEPQQTRSPLLRVSRETSGYCSRKCNVVYFHRCIVNTNQWCV